jgi:hypothetical protein
MLTISDRFARVARQASQDMLEQGADGDQPFPKQIIL